MSFSIYPLHYLVNWHNMSSDVHRVTKLCWICRDRSYTFIFIVRNHVATVRGPRTHSHCCSRCGCNWFFLSSLFVAAGPRREPEESIHSPVSDPCLSTEPLACARSLAMALLSSILQTKLGCRSTPSRAFHLSLLLPAPPEVTQPTLPQAALEWSPPSHSSRWSWFLSRTPCSCQCIRLAPFYSDHRSIRSVSVAT